jgi:hypothetical protein
LIDGTVTLPIEGPIGTVETRTRTLTVYHGLAGPAPAFDPTGLGEEQPLALAQPHWDQSDPGPVPVVYIGDVNGRSVFVHTNGGISWLDRAEAWLQNSEIGPHICLTVGDSETVGGGGFCGDPIQESVGMIVEGSLVKNGPAGPLGDFITWIDTPEGTSVVAMELEDGRRWWQRPMGETAFFDFQGIYSGRITMTALDAQGETLYQREWDSYSQTEAGRNGFPPTSVIVEGDPTDGRQAPPISP